MCLNNTVVYLKFVSIFTCVTIILQYYDVAVCPVKGKLKIEMLNVLSLTQGLCLKEALNT